MGGDWNGIGVTLGTRTPTLELYKDDPEQIYTLIELSKYYFEYWLMAVLSLLAT